MNVPLCGIVNSSKASWWNKHCHTWSQTLTLQKGRTSACHSCTPSSALPSWPIAHSYNCIFCFYILEETFKGLFWINTKMVHKPKRFLAGHILKAHLFHKDQKKGIINKPIKMSLKLNGCDLAWWEVQCNEAEFHLRLQENKLSHIINNGKHALNCSVRSWLTQHQGSTRLNC